jgi:type IV pilus assembly protein PilM
MVRLTLSFDGAVLRMLTHEKTQVEDWISLPFNPNLLKKGFINDEAGMAKIIKNALSSKKILAREVVASLPGFDSLVRIIPLPKGKGVEPQIVIPREMRRVASVSLENNYLFWQALAPSEKERPFFTLAVPKEPLDALIRTLKLAGLTPSSIDLSPLALARAVNQSEAIIARAENNGFDIIVMANSLPAGVRSFFVEEEFNPDNISARLTEEIERTITFYSSSRTGAPLSPDTPLYLCGFLSAYPDLAKELEEATGRPVGQPDMVLQFPRDFPASQMMVNLGLALKTL